MLYNVFVGVDQTGAVDSKGRPKQLKISILDKRNGQIKLVNNIRIGSMNPFILFNTLTNHLDEPIGKNDSLFVLVDCVFGLPRDLKFPFFEIGQKMRNFKSVSGKEYGSKVAHEFFISFLESLDEIPEREADRRLSGQSVFKLYPFQKNISCGSFRILKDLFSCEYKFGIWPFRGWEKFQIVYAEGYPSFYWKIFLESKVRNINLLSEYVLKNYEGAIAPLDDDFADAAVLAISASRIIEGGYLENSLNEEIKEFEGWIFGLI